MNKKEIDVFNVVNDKLLLYDWFISPYQIISDDFQLLVDPINRFSSNPTPDEKYRYGKMVSDELIKMTLNYNFRAVLVCEGYLIAPTIKDFGHIFEIGLFEFYGLNFLTCIGVWVPLVEGLIRALLGITYTRGMVKYNDIINLRAKDPVQQDGLDAITGRLVSCLSSVLYKSVVNDSDLPMLNLDRHAFVHLPTKQPMYHRDNCLKLLNILDTLLAIDFFVNDRFKVFLNTKDGRINLRETCYEDTVRESLGTTNLMRIELLKNFPNFKESFYYGRS